MVSISVSSSRSASASALSIASRWPAGLIRFAPYPNVETARIALQKHIGLNKLNNRQTRLG